MPNGEMSVAQMRTMIESGNVVSYRGRILRDVRDLPTEADNAVTLDEKIAARDRLVAEHDGRQAEIDRLNAEIEDLQTRPAAPAGTQAPSPAAATGAAGAAATLTPPTVQLDGQRNPPADDEEDPYAGLKNPDQEFAGHPLRFFFDMTKTAKDEAEARSRIMSVRGVGEATADQIIAALKDSD
jgi:hypothetical protein